MKDLFSVSGKVALVTGGSRGIGLMIARGLVENGVKTYISSRSKEACEEAASELSKIGECIDLPSDLSNIEGIQNLSREIISREDKLHILINNAGITGSNATVWDYDVNEWNKVLDINLLGTFYCCKTIVPHMIKKNYGRIVNVASVAGKDGNPNASAYSSAKAGIIGLTKSLGKELADKNIAVNAVTPSTANTKILDQMSDKHVKYMLSKVPRARFLELEEFSSLVCWLSSEENSFSTAAVFDISGGRSTY